MLFVDQEWLSHAYFKVMAPPPKLNSWQIDVFLKEAHLRCVLIVSHGELVYVYLYLYS